MLKIVLGRGKGKTDILINESSRTKYIIVCADERECLLIKERAASLNLEIPDPITYDKFTSRTYEGKRILGFLLDNVDTFVQSMTRFRVGAITMSPSDESLNDVWEI